MRERTLQIVCVLVLLLKQSSANMDKMAFAIGYVFRHGSAQRENATIKRSVGNDKSFYRLKFNGNSGFYSLQVDTLFLLLLLHRTHNAAAS